MPDETHACPVGRCVTRVQHHQLMCKRHWKMVPPAVQRRVYATWSNGRGAGTDEHIAAMDEAVAAVEQRMAER